MRLKVKGELPIFNKLITYLGEEICDMDPAAEATIELLDDDNHGNALGLKWGEHTYVRITLHYWAKDKFAFRMACIKGTGVNRTHVEETGIFPHTELDRGIRAAASYLKQLMFELTEGDFKHHFEQTKR